jgi:hypothetical protein
MSKKRFLVPVLVLAALAMPARATLVDYCNAGCGTNTLSVFNSLTSGDSFASTSPITFGGAPVSEYTDGLTNVLFQATHGFTISGGVLDTQNNQGDTLIVTIPSTFTVVILTLTSQNGTGGFYLDSSGNVIANLSSTPTTVGYINDSVTGDWTIGISKLGGAYSVAVNNFNVANAGTSSSETPEVGTLLLIGAGLISMRLLRHLPRKLFRPARTLRTA